MLDDERTMTVAAKVLSVISTCLLIASCASQPENTLTPLVTVAPGADATDQTIADFCLTCASARMSDYFVLKASGKDADSLNVEIGYWVSVGRAYSSETYAGKKFRQLRDTQYTRSSQAVSVSKDSLAASATAYLNTLQAQIAECATYQRANRDQLLARLRQSGVLDK